MLVTETGYKKNILGATGPVRQYFKRVGMHDYSLQAQGQENKALQATVGLDGASMYPTVVFKIKKQARPMLFPESEQIPLR